MVPLERTVFVIPLAQNQRDTLQPRKGPGVDVGFHDYISLEVVVSGNSPVNIKKKNMGNRVSLGFMIPDVWWMFTDVPFVSSLEGDKCEHLPNNWVTISQAR